MYSLVMVGDEEVVLDNMAGSFDWEKMGFHLAAAFTDAASALDSLEWNAADLLITDIRMPAMSGLDFAQAVLEKNPETLVVFLTAYKDFEYAHRGIDIGVFSYLLKPVTYHDIQELCEKAKNTLDSRMPTAVKNTAAYFSGKRPTGDALMESAKAYVEKHYMESLTLSEIASHVYLSEYYFCRYFKKNMGINFVDYLNKVRIEHAQTLLRETNLKTSEICARVGYISLKYFHRKFKALTGITPKEYRGVILSSRIL